ncbi:hypothetical protein [Flavobacterium sp. GCM10023249]|uniref:hypothetical protein n=1 Tax=unclassified Flavobacterium TaxID=196869 RepID=UPI0036188F5A
MGWKTIAAITLAGASITALYVKNKVDRMTKQFENIQIIPVGFRGLKLKWNNGFPLLEFKVDFKLTNPQPEPFDLNGFIAKLQRIIIYDGKGKPLGVSTPNLDRLTIPGNGTSTLPNVPFTVDATQLLKNIVDYKNINLSNFKFEGIISILGTEHKI